MGQKIITLSGAATDVLYSLFFRGALQSGELPAKSGAAELRELGFAETRHTATEYQKENYFTFLTAEGQEFAIKHLVNTRFGVPAGGYIGSPLDALDEIADLPRYKIGSDYAIQKKIADALDTALARHYEQFGNTEPEKTAVVFLEHRWVAIQGGYTPDEMRDAVEHIKRLRKQKADEKAMEESSPFVMKDGQVFIKNAVIPKVQLSRTETDPRKGYAINVGIGPEIKTSVKLSPEMEKAISDVVSAELKKNLKPGGTVWEWLRRGF
ncbi:hypothetical protein ACM7TS_13585, partial [Enterobacter hormaechei]